MLEQSGIDIQQRRASEPPDQLGRDSVQRVQNKIRASEEEVKVLL
jgi:hypothetical protein